MHHKRIFQIYFSTSLIIHKILVASENNECYKISKDTPRKYFSALFNTKDDVSFLKHIWKSSLPIIPMQGLEGLDTNPYEGIREDIKNYKQDSIRAKKICRDRKQPKILTTSRTSPVHALNQCFSNSNKI